MSWAGGNTLMKLVSGDKKKKNYNTVAW
jgi:hypothetical protein